MENKMTRKKISEFLMGVAPTVAKAIGGPYARMAIKFIGEKILKDPDATESQIESALTATTFDDFKTLRELELSFETEMRELDIDILELEVKDRTGARDLFKLNMWPQMLLTLVFVLLYFYVLIVVFRAGMDVANTSSPGIENFPEWLRGVFITVLGVLTAAIPQILNFWFGSSLGSKQKTEGMLGQALK